MNQVLSHFIRPLLILTLLLAPTASAGVFLQLDVATETRAKDALVRFLAHPDSSSAISASGTFAESEINVRANGKQMVALETTIPEGMLNARIELIAASGFAPADSLEMAFKFDQSTPTPMVAIQNGLVTHTTGPASMLSQMERGQIMYQPSKGLSLTAAAHLQLVLTPVGLDSIEVRYDFYLLGTLTGPILIM